MKKGISVFLGLELSLEENLEYIREAKANGFTEIFTSMHIPEADYEVIKSGIKILLNESKELGMSVSVDVSPNTFDLLGIEKNDFKKLKEYGINTVRLDFGYNIDEIAKLTNNDYGLSIQLNASTLNKDMLSELESKNANFDNITACHNYYPRENTGISEKLFVERNNEFKKRGIKVSAFIPSHNKMRGPVYEGLPTLEKHRWESPYISAKHLFCLGTDVVYFGDLKASYGELCEVGGIKTPFEFRIKIETLNKDIKSYLLSNIFSQRMDEAEEVVRIEESRYYFNNENPVEFKKREIKPRPRGSITIDNEKYLRYMGEMQILKVSLLSDERVNVVARISPEDLFLLDYIRGGDKLNFIL